MPPGLKGHDFHGSAANPAQNGTLRHPGINLVLSHRALEKVDKYRAGYAAQDSCRALLPAVVSTSGRIHGEFLRLLCLLADNKTKLHFRALLTALDEAIDDKNLMLTRKPTVGGGAGFSGACGPPSAWRVLRPLPCPLRFSAKAARGPAPGAHVFEPCLLYTSPSPRDKRQSRMPSSA